MSVWKDTVELQINSEEAYKKARRVNDINYQKHFIQDLYAPAPRNKTEAQQQEITDHRARYRRWCLWFSK